MRFCEPFFAGPTHQRTQSLHFPSSFIITRPLPAARALKHQAPCLIHEHSTGSDRVDALGLRAVGVIICMITRDFSVISIDVTGVSLSLSLSLSLPLTKVTHAQYRKRFRASYNTTSNKRPKWEYVQIQKRTKVLKIHSQKAKKDYPSAESLKEGADSTTLRKSKKRQVGFSLRMILAKALAQHNISSIAWRRGLRIPPLSV